MKPFVTLLFLIVHLGNTSHLGDEEAYIYYYTNSLEKLNGMRPLSVY